jgi:hypothetical protein
MHVVFSEEPRAMNHLRHRSFPRIGLSLVAALLVWGCGDGSPIETEDPPGEREVGVVVNSVELTLTIFETEDPGAPVRTVELGVADGTPVSAALRGRYALVPLGIVPSAILVDLEEAAPVRSIPLPEGSGATGAIFVNDSIALVANPDRGSVTPLNVLRGTSAQEIATGDYPNGFARAGGRVAVVNAELVSFAPARNSTLTILDEASLAVVGQVELSGENAGPALTNGDGLLYVLNAGRFGEASASLSVVDLEAMSEVAHHEGFGDFPGSLARSAAGDLYLSSWNFGVASWDPSTSTFARSPEDPITPGGIPSSSGVAADSEGRIYSLEPVCDGPGRVFVLGPNHAVEREVPTGICPSGLVFTWLERG